MNLPELRLAPRLVHGLRRWDERHDVQLARGRRRAWFSRIKQAKLHEPNALASPIRRWQQWIVNFFRDRVTHGVTAGINTKIKLLKRVAYGLPNFAPLRARILLASTPEVTSPLWHKLCQRAK